MGFPRIKCGVNPSYLLQVALRLGPDMTDHLLSPTATSV
jgi:hypothetical protein